MTPDFIQRLQHLLMTVLSTLIVSLIGLGSWVVYTTHNASVSIPDLYDKMDQVSHQIEQVRKDGDNRDKDQSKRNDQVDQLLKQHNMEISEALAEHNREIDNSISTMTATLDNHSTDLRDLKNFVQSLRDQKQVIIVHHAEAEAPANSTQTPVRTVGTILSELLGVAPKHHRAGSGRRPGQPKRTR